MKKAKGVLKTKRVTTTLLIISLFLLVFTGCDAISGGDSSLVQDGPSHPQSYDEYVGEDYVVFPISGAQVDGLREDWIINFSNSMGGEGEVEELSWFANTGNFVIEFEDGSTMAKSELAALYAF